MGSHRGDRGIDVEKVAPLCFSKLENAYRTMGDIIERRWDIGRSFPSDDDVKRP